MFNSLHQAFVYFESLPFHAGQVVYCQLVWGFVLKMASHSFIFCGFNHMESQTKTVMWSLQITMVRLCVITIFTLCHTQCKLSCWLILLFFLSEVMSMGMNWDIVHQHYLDTNKQRKSCYLKKYKTHDYTRVLGAGGICVDQSSLQAMPDQRPHDNNSLSSQL